MTERPSILWRCAFLGGVLAVMATQAPLLAAGALLTSRRLWWILAALFAAGIIAKRLSA